MATVRELFIEWGFAVDDKKLKSLSKEIDEVKAGAGRAGGAIKNVAAVAAGLVGVASAGAAALFGLAKSAANAGDEMVKTSQKTGVSIEALQELKYAGDLSDVSFEELANGLKFLNRNMNESTRSATGPAALAFKELGIKATDASGKLRPTEAVFRDMTAALARMPDGAKKTALSMDVFGKSGAMLIPLLNGGTAGLDAMADEARRLGLIMSDENAKAGEEFNDAITRAEGAVRGIFLAIGNKLIPVLHEIVVAIQEWVEVNREWLDENIQKAVTALSEGLKVFWDWVKKIAAAVGDWIEEQGGLEPALNKIVDVVKAIAVAWLAWQAANVLLGIGQMTMGVVGLGKELATTKAGAWALKSAWVAVKAASTFLVNQNPILKGIATAIWSKIAALAIAAKAWAAAWLAAAAPVVLVIAAILAVVAEIVLLGIWINSIVQKFGGWALLWDDIKFAFGMMVEGIKGIGGELLAWFGGLWTGVGEGFSSVIDFITGLWDSAVAFITDKIDWIVSKAKSIGAFFGIGDGAGAGTTTAAGAASTIAPSLAPATTPGGQRNVNVDASVSVAFPQGTNPGQMEDAKRDFRKIAREEFGRVLRETEANP